MKKKGITIFLAAVVLVLLVSIGLVVYSLSNNAEPPPIVTKQTKAAPITYNRTIPLTSPTPTDLPTPTPLLATGSALISPTSEPLVANITSAPPGFGVTTTVTPTFQPIQTLPTTGFSQYTVFFIAAAGGLVLMSLLY